MKSEIEISPELKYNNQIAEATAHALNDGDHGLKALPGLLRIMLNPEKQCWKERYVHQLREVVLFNSFEQYVITDPPKGLGADTEILKRLCPGPENADVRNMIDEAIQGTAGGDRGNQYTGGKLYNVQNASPAPAGNTEAAALRRLRKSAPKLHEKVIAGEMSANAAMVKAGFRPKTITVPVDVKKAAKVLARNFQDDASKLIEALRELI